MKTGQSSTCSCPEFAIAPAARKGRISSNNPPDSATPSARCTGIALDPATGNVSFQWGGVGRAFQLEGATNVLGPWLPLSPVLVEPPTLDAGALTNAPQGFHRRRLW